SLNITAADYLRAMRIRREMKQDFARVFAEIDVLFAPSRHGPASKLTEPIDIAASIRPDSRHRGLIHLVQAGTLVGAPALSLPSRFVAYLPVAVQLVGSPYSENWLLAIGKEYQSKTDWHRRRPNVG